MKCEEQNVGVARSNPCFELWLILHQQDYDKPEDRHAMQKATRKVAAGIRSRMARRHPTATI